VAHGPSACTSINAARRSPDPNPTVTERHQALTPDVHLDGEHECQHLALGEAQVRVRADRRERVDDVE
jgi:hypothetical protein